MSMNYVIGMLLPTAHAAPIQSAPEVSITSVGGVLCYIVYGFDLMFWFLIALSAVMVVVGAYNYLTSQGDSEKVSKGTKTLMWAAIAVAVALIAKNVPTIVGSFFGVSGSEQSPIGSC
jgi:hypothetical protein